MPATDPCANAFLTITAFDGGFDDVVFGKVLVEASEGVEHDAKK